ncbi:hypothetical protein PM082_007129 [Marasmius tenuissimus]|nr:hypothetical protein PM082_007129 [Marasmius tenuissimus]
MNAHNEQHTVRIMSLTGLPIELLLMIIEAAEGSKTDSLRSLRSVNRTLSTLVEPYLFRSVIFDSDQRKLGRSFDLLTDLRHHRSRITPHIQNITIRCFDRLWASHLHCHDHEKSEKVQEKFRVGLSEALGGGMLHKLVSFQILAGSDSLSTAFVWPCLQRNHIYLRKLDICTRIERPFADYLASYAGLEDLKVRRAYSSLEGDYELTEDFIGSALMNHAKTLKSLTITAADEGPWCLGRHNVNAFVEYDNLRRLCVSINSEELGTIKSEEDDILALALSLTHRMLHLSSLSLSTANSRRWRGPWEEEHKPYTARLLAKRVLSYEYSLHRSKAPEIEIEGQVYKCREGDSFYWPSISEKDVRMGRTGIRP